MTTITDHAELISYYASGTEEKRYTTVAAQSKHFAVFKVAGHRYWADVMNPSEYARTHYVLMRKGEWCLRGKVINEWEGRVSPKLLQAALDAAEVSKRQQERK